MKVLVGAMAAGAIGCAGLLPATAAHAQVTGDSLPEGALRSLDSALSVAGLGSSLLSGGYSGVVSGDQVAVPVAAPVDVCNNAVGVLGTAVAGTADEAAAARAPMLSHGTVEATPEKSKAASKKSKAAEDPPAAVPAVREARPAVVPVVAPAGRVPAAAAVPGAPAACRVACPAVVPAVPAAGCRVEPLAAPAFFRSPAARAPRWPRSAYC